MPSPPSGGTESSIGTPTEICTGTIAALSVPLLVGWRALDTVGSATYSISATARVFIWGSTALGALTGGVIGQRLGLYAMLLLAALGLLISRVREYGRRTIEG